jgi:hypothetical protein
MRFVASEAWRRFRLSMTRMVMVGTQGISLGSRAFPSGAFPVKPRLTGTLRAFARQPSAYQVV